MSLSAQSIGGITLGALSRLARITLSAALLMGAFTAAADAQQLRKITFLVPTTVISEAFSPFLVAKYMGYFKDEGLDVNLIASGGSNASAIGVSSGAGDLGAASPAQSIVGMQDGTLDIKYVYDLYYGSIWATSVMKDSPIKSFKELKGKKIGVTAMGSAGITYGEALAREAGLDKTDVSFISVGAGAQAMTSLRQGLVDALIFSSEATAKFEVAGLPLRYLPMSGGFATFPDASIVAKQEMIAKEPKVISGFARAVAKGYVFTMANPEAAVRISWKLVPEAEPKVGTPEEILKGGIAVNLKRMEIWSSPETNGVYGLFVAKSWDDLVTYLVDTGVLKQKVPTSRIFTNDFIKDANDFDRAAVQAQAKAFDLGKLK
ncbi:ABC transporter substrate-binding protein [Aquabacter sp. CN5-332]|uniref:ABC transporter substrate-binding protein n=1 Tax=Aquabacter sp. CN5-332 TaxID=3156608 RepID=UPI0032B3D9B4